MYRAGDYPETLSEHFELLSRAVFSAGLGPHVVANRWDSMTEIFHHWDPMQVAKLTQDDISRLLSNVNIIRNRRKIEAVIENAKRLTIPQPDGTIWTSYPQFLNRMVEAQGYAGAAESLSEIFLGLGRTSAMFYLFAAGYRSQSNRKREPPCPTFTETSSATEEKPPAEAVKTAASTLPPEAGPEA